MNEKLLLAILNNSFIHHWKENLMLGYLVYPEGTLVLFTFPHNASGLSKTLFKFSTYFLLEENYGWKLQTYFLSTHSNKVIKLMDKEFYLPATSLTG